MRLISYPNLKLRLRLDVMAIEAKNYFSFRIVDKFEKSLAVYQTMNIYYYLKK